MFSPPPKSFFKTCCSLTKMFRMYGFKGRSLYTKKLLAYLARRIMAEKPFLQSFVHGPRKHILIVNN